MTMMSANGKILARNSAMGSGKNIYSTIADAIADASNIKVGSFFETNGFHSSGDGGAARYFVSENGTANGKNIIQLASGKNAYLQWGDWIVPEQLGYQQSYSRDDVVPYIQHAISIGCQHIHLRSSGNGAGYTWKTKLTLNIRGFKLTGEGDWGYPNKFSYIVFRPENENVDAMMELNMRSVELQDLDIEVTGDYVQQVDCVTCTTYSHDETRYWYFKNVRTNSFRYAFDLRGGIKWHIDFTNCLFNSGKYGIRFFESSTMLATLHNVLFTNLSECDLIFDGNVYTCLCENCNFGIQKQAVVFRRSSTNYHYQNVNFTNCQFEIDNTEIDNIDAVVFDFANDIDQNVSVNNCNFTLIRNMWTEYPNIRGIKLANKTNLLLKSCTILGSDPEQAMAMPFEKMWNETALPINGGITFVGEQVQVVLPTPLKKYAIVRGQANQILASNSTATDTAWNDCNTWVPDSSGVCKVARVSTYEGTANMPTTSIFGFLWVIGIIDGPNLRVLQRIEASNGNLYTRVGRNTGSGWTFDPWKTITAV